MYRKSQWGKRSFTEWNSQLQRLERIVVIFKRNVWNDLCSPFWAGIKQSAQRSVIKRRCAFFAFYPINGRIQCASVFMLHQFAQTYKESSSTSLIKCIRDFVSKTSKRAIPYVCNIDPQIDNITCCFIHCAKLYKRMQLVWVQTQEFCKNAWIRLTCTRHATSVSYLST